MHRVCDDDVGELGVFFDMENAFERIGCLTMKTRLLAILAAVTASTTFATERWSTEKANDWYASKPWPVGANFVPSSSANQLEMWQTETFDPAAIDRELGWAASLGMNTMRVFLHDIAWRTDEKAFFKRVDRYLEISDKHGIKTMIVFFDGVWDPNPKAGKQPTPRPGLHNSSWVQSPGREILDDPAKQDALKPYVQAVLTRYKDDKRILVWDLFNEPDNTSDSSYGIRGTQEELDAATKEKRASELLAKTFAWAREIDPSQPLTVGVWRGDYLGKPGAFHKLCLDHSDVLSFHTYDDPAKTRELVLGLKKLNRPILCTEYMARGNNSTFEGILPIFKEHKIGAYNWGFVDGRSQTIYPWDSWQKAYEKEPDPWFHDIFRRDGTPYREDEVAFIRKMTGYKK